MEASPVRWNDTTHVTHELNVMAASPIIVVTGLPASGKTSIANCLHERLMLPIASKDRFKELLFDTLSWSDRAWSKRLDIASAALLFQFLEGQAAVGRSCIIDHWFNSTDDIQRLVNVQSKYKVIIIQVLCYADGNILVDRFKERSLSGMRHPGHCDHLTFDEHRPILLSGRMKSLPSKGPLIELDTTDFDSIDFESVIKSTTNAMKT